MRKYLIVLVVACLAMTATPPAYAFKQVSDLFKEVYDGDDANEDFKALVAKAKCYICHVKAEKSKKVRNPYGKALHELMEKEEFPVKDFKKDPKKYADQLKKIFEKAEEEKTEDKEHNTFGARIKANLLPGGDVEGK